MMQPAFRSLLLLGAGHGHLDLIKHLGTLTKAGVEVTVVSPEPVALYSGMVPGLLGGRYRREEVSLPVREIVEAQQATFIAERVTAINAAAHAVTLESGQELSYEVLSVALGSIVATDRLPTFEGTPEDGVYPVKPYANVEAARERVRNLLSRASGRRVRAVVVGGGPAAVEVAGNLARLGREARTEAGGTTAGLEVALVCGGEPLAQFPPGCRRTALGALSELGVKLCRGTRARHVEPGLVQLQDGVEEPADLIILAPGVKPPPVLAASDLPTAPDGALPVDASMRMHTDSPVFAAGDAAHLVGNPLARIGAFALREGRALRRNLIRLVLTGEVRRPATYSPTHSVFLALNLGDGRSAACFHGMSLFGRWVFALKELIDRSFVARTVRSARKSARNRKSTESVVAG